MKPISQWTFPQVVEFVKNVDKKVWMTVFLIAVGLLVFFVFLVIPAWVERPLLRRDIQTMEAQIRQVDALNKRRLVWDENQKTFGSLIEETHARLFTVDDLGVLLGQVSKMADEVHVDVIAAKPLAEKYVFPPPYGFKYVPRSYEFTIQGGYHDLAALMGRIESHGKLLRIRSLQIVSSEKTPDRHIADVKLWAILAAPPQVAASTKSVGVSRAKK